MSKRFIPLSKDALSLVASLEAENERLRALLNDPQYIRMKADYNQGRLSWANMIEARERGLNLTEQRTKD